MIHPTSRRHFLAGLGAAVVALTVGRLPFGWHPRPTADIPRLDLRQLQREQGRTVKLVAAAEGEHQARFVSLRRERDYDRRSAVAVEQFSLLLHAPGAAPGRYAVEFSGGDCLELDLLPSGRPEQGYLQAACSRLRGRVA